MHPIVTTLCIFAIGTALGQPAFNPNFPRNINIYPNVLNIPFGGGVQVRVNDAARGNAAIATDLQGSFWNHWRAPANRPALQAEWVGHNGDGSSANILIDGPHVVTFEQLCLALGLSAQQVVDFFGMQWTPTTAAQLALQLEYQLEYHVTGNPKKHHTFVLTILDPPAWLFAAHSPV